MIQANELRIGNWIMWVDEDIKRPCEISLILINEEAFIVNGFESGFFEPIPVTEEWLNMFGFERFSPERNVWMLKVDEISSPISFNANEMRFISGHPELLKCDKVHLFQNCFHSLTGQELKLKDQ